MKVLNDLLWDGDLKIYQDTDSFKLSIDSILLSNFVTLNKSISNILDIGTGNAPIPLMLSKRTDAHIDAIEIQEESYLLALDNVKYNKLDNKINIIFGNIKEEYKDISNNYFDTIVSNPPYFKGNMKISSKISKQIARNEQQLTIEDVVKISKKLLKNGGNLAMVVPTDRFVEIIEIMKKNTIEPKRVQFVYPNCSKNSKFFLIEGNKNGNSGLKVLPPIYIQNNDGKYTDFIDYMMKNFGK